MSPKQKEREILWKKYARDIRRIELKYFSIFEEAANEQVKAFIRDLKEGGVQQATNNANLTAFNEAFYEPLKALYIEAGVQGIERVRGEIKRDAGRKWSGFGVNAGWVEQIMAYLEINILNRAILPITATMRKMLLDSVTNGLAEGMSVDEMIRQIENDGTPAYLTRLRVRTEAVKAANVGHVIGARSSGFEVMKIWVAALDHRTRHTHYNLNNVGVEESGVFSNGLKFPSDPDSNNAAEVCNCRCRVVYEAKRDNRGRVITRAT